MTAATVWDAVVVGAGIAGLLAAREIAGSGRRVLVLDKSRGIGGRMATRRVGAAICDHGAQFFTVRGETFSGLVAEAQAAEAVATWCRGFSKPQGEPGRAETAADGHPRWRGVRGMTDLPKWAAARLPDACTVRTGAKAAAVRIDGSRVVIDLEADGSASESFVSRAVVLSPPVPQSLDILAAGGLLDAGGLPVASPLDAASVDLLRAVGYDPCFAFMLVLATASRVPPPGAVQFDPDGPGPIAWLADNQQKGISPVPAITAHATGRFSRDHFETPPDEVAAMLLEHLVPWIDGPPATAVLDRSLHRWKFALPTRLVPEPCVTVATVPPIICCGDAFAGPRVEGAAVSGTEAGRLVARMLAAG